MFENSIDISALNAALGAYCQHDGVYNVKQVFSKLQSFDHVTVFDKIKDRLPMITPTIGNVVQKGETGRFNPPKNVTFEVNILEVQPWKVDMSIDPLSHHKSYLAKREAPGSLFTQSWIFEEYLTNMIVLAAKNDVEGAIWRGEFDPTVAADGVANPLVVCDGFLKIIADNIADLNVATTGAITLTNAVDAFEQVWDAVPYSIRQEGMKLYCSEPVWDKYKKNYRERFGMLPYNKEYNKFVLDSAGSKLEIVPIREMGNSQRLIIDALGVMTIGTDLGLDFQRLMTEADIKTRTINMIMDGKIGVGISAFYGNGSTKLLTVNNAL